MSAASVPSASQKIAAAVGPVVELIAADKALMSLRSSGHDYNSAIGEVVDNSLQANANNIRVRIFTVKKVVKKNKNATEVVERIAVGDDGDGMANDILHNSLKLGFSSRYNDRKGMGRFGVGATLGGISQCKRIDIYSRESENDPWLHTYIDLDEIDAGQMAVIPPPVLTEVPQDCKDLVGGKGTLVVWSKTDRLEETEAGGGRRADTVKSDLMNYIARTFRKFIDSGINIDLNNVKVFPHDPLFLMTSTRFHQTDKGHATDPVAEIKVKDHFDFALPSDPTKTSRVWVTVTLLPKEFRAVRGRGGDDFEGRRIDENEGVSILRADREIFNGWLRGVQPSQAERQLDRFIGKEIRFEPALDECFHVRNVKKGAEPIEGLRDMLRTYIFKTIGTLRDDIRKHFDEVMSKTLTNDGIHAEAEKVAAETQRTARKPKAGKKTTKEEREREIDAAVESLSKGTPEELRPQKKAQVKAKIEQQPFTIVPETWPGQEFMEIKHLGTNVIVRLNMQHPFYTEVYSKLIAAENDENDLQKKELARQVRNGIDLLIVGYARGEGQYEDPSVFDSLRTNWGLELRTLIQHWVKKH